MQIIVRQQNPQNINYNNNGLGFKVREPYCMEPECVPQPNSIPTSPTLKPKLYRPLQKLEACKTSKSSNNWKFQGATYPDFNSLWLNIPKRFVVLRTDGKNC